MQIQPSFGVSSTSGIDSASRAKPTQSNPVQGSQSIAPVDILDISSEALSQAEQSTGGIRTEKVAELRRAIAEGTYDTDEKLSAALDNFLDQIG